MILGCIALAPLLHVLVQLPFFFELLWSDEDEEHEIRLLQQEALKCGLRPAPSNSRVAPDEHPMPPRWVAHMARVGQFRMPIPYAPLNACMQILGRSGAILSREQVPLDA
eukprot:scaffold139247_cov19-Tisochrysis_lutea.AAC.1